MSLLNWQFITKYSKAMFLITNNQMEITKRFLTWVKSLEHINKILKSYNFPLEL